MTKTTDQLSMSMFATRADYDAAARAQAEQLPDWLQQTGINSPLNGCMYRDDCRAEHAQRQKLQHHACNLEQRAADLEGERNELIDQRDRGDAQNDLLLAELRQVNTERDALRARLAEIESQEHKA